MELLGNEGSVEGSSCVVETVDDSDNFLKPVPDPKPGIIEGTCFGSENEASVPLTIFAITGTWISGAVLSEGVEFLGAPKSNPDEVIESFMNPPVFAPNRDEIGFFTVEVFKASDDLSVETNAGVTLPDVSVFVVWLFESSSSESTSAK
uniref:CSON009695 protein n=1 Tax=Culicoides sonorensis TaxID=179676 RepID=A0A336LES1_CULSO